MLMQDLLVTSVQVYFFFYTIIHIFTQEQNVDTSDTCASFYWGLWFSYRLVLQKQQKLQQQRQRTQSPVSLCLSWSIQRSTNMDKSEKLCSCATGLHMKESLLGYFQLDKIKFTLSIYLSIYHWRQASKLQSSRTNLINARSFFEIFSWGTM